MLATHVLVQHLKCPATSGGHMMARTKSGLRLLTAEEKQELRRDMTESSAWAKAELKRRRVAKNQKNLNMVYMMVLRMNASISSCYISLFSYNLH